MGKRLVAAGMRVAVIDVSDRELAAAQAELPEILPLKCNVAKMENCKAASDAVVAAFPDRSISFLFNNAGILGKEGMATILEGEAGTWPEGFSVNVFGAVNIFKAFLPLMIDAGSLQSGKKSIVVTTSSVVGLVNSNIGPYACSKSAVTAVCEQLSHELEKLGSRAAHISPHSLHPTVTETPFFGGRDAEGRMTNADGEVRKLLAGSDVASADGV